jgi:hypothetical protein
VTTKKRIDNFDFLRGFFVFLALYQHFTYYLNHWYKWIIDQSDAATSSIFSFHSSFYNMPVVTDAIGEKIFWFFTPWVSQIYLCLAAFNLANKDREIFTKTYKGKLSIYAWLFILFFCENAVVAFGRGELFSFYPLMAWMIILGILTILYRFVGFKWIVGIYILSLFHTFTPLDAWTTQLVNYFKINYHPEFEYDARIHYFFSSGALGFILGHLYYHHEWFTSKSRLGVTYAISAAMFLTWLFLGQSFPVDVSNVLKTEHFFNQSFTGIIFNQSVQILLLTSFLVLHLKKIYIPKNVFHWVGVNSLLVFAFHRIFFIYLIAPFREIIGGVFHLKMSAYTLEVFSYCFISFFMSYLLLKSPIKALIFKK